MSSDYNLTTLIEMAEHHWHKPIGAILAIVIAYILEGILLNIVKPPLFITVFVMLVTIPITWYVWYCSSQPTKTPKDKVGFAVCIQCSDEKEEQVIREDFVHTLRRILKEGELGQTFHFYEVPKHISQSINDIDDAQKLRLKIYSHFLVYGRVRLRVLGGEKFHILELDGIVSHKPLARQTGKQLSNEFSELFPRRLHISTENDLLSLRFTSDWTECVAKYIIGIAAYLSHDINYAEKLYKDVEKRLEDLETDFPIFAKLKERLPIRFAEIYTDKAKLSLSAWRISKDPVHYSQFVDNLNKIPSAWSNNYSVLCLRCIEAFLDGRRIKDAINIANKCNKFDDPIWHFNLAFLWGYQGDLKKSIRQYRKCAKFEVEPTTISQVDDFLVWILEEEPDKYQLHFCLGFFNWKIRGDLQRAINDLKAFLKHGNDGEFEAERALASQWIAQIETELRKVS